MNRRSFLSLSLRSMLADTNSSRRGAASLIDSHVHVWEHRPDFPFAEGAKPPAYDNSAEDLLKLIKVNGVARTVLIQVIHYRWDNRYLVDVLQRYPGKFHGVCRVNPEDPGAPDHLSQLTEQGCHGVRLSPDATAKSDWIRGSLMAPLWQRCAQIRVPMTLLLPASRLPDVMPWIERNPDLDVVIDHMADVPADDPKGFQLLLQTARYPRVYLKISHMWSLSHRSYPYPDMAEQVARLRDRFGANRLMWGTDWPIVRETLPYAQRVALYRDHLGFLTSSERADILYKTVQRVWPFHL